MEGKVLVLDNIKGMGQADETGVATANVCAVD